MTEEANKTAAAAAHERTRNTVREEITNLIREVETLAFDRGFKAGLRLGKKSDEPPTGLCGACRGPLVWINEFSPCGCRDCRCEKCNLDFESPCPGCAEL